MVTFVLSEFPHNWNISRFSDSDGVTHILTVKTEEQAKQIAHRIARKEIPSRIVRIGMNGQHSVIEALNE